MQGSDLLQVLFQLSPVQFVLFCLGCNRSWSRVDSPISHRSNHLPGIPSVPLQNAQRYFSLALLKIAKINSSGSTIGRMLAVRLHSLIGKE
jgi:hypothetical protein